MKVADPALFNKTGFIGMFWELTGGDPRRQIPFHDRLPKDTRGEREGDGTRAARMGPLLSQKLHCLTPSRSSALTRNSISLTCRLPYFAAIECRHAPNLASIPRFNSANDLQGDRKHALFAHHAARP